MQFLSDTLNIDELSGPYAVGQCADILAFRANVVPVGEDQAPHLEMTREVARRFNHLFCGVPAETDDTDHERAGGVFPIPHMLVGRVARLTGTDGVDKMSKSRGNAIYLSDSTDEIRRKMARPHTGRQLMTEPGDPDNVLFQYARAFMPGDAAIKSEGADAIDRLVAPMRARRAEFTDAKVLAILRDHTARANAVADATLARVKQAMRLDFGAR